MSSVRRPPGTTRHQFTMVNGITDRNGMPRLGKLRLGEKGLTDAGKEYPKETQYFRCDPDKGMLKTETDRMLERFTALYGKEPKVLTNVFLPSDDPGFVFPNSLEAWARTQNGSKRWCHGNGVSAERLNFETGEWSEMACCHVEQCPVMEARDCKLISRLRVFLPEVSMSGYWQIDTSSQASTANVLDCLNQLRGVFGRLTSIPLVLSREPKAMTFDAKTNIHYILHLRAPNIAFDEFKQLVARQQFALPAATTFDVDDEDIPEELVPGGVQDVAPATPHFSEPQPAVQPPAPPEKQPDGPKVVSVRVAQTGTNKKGAWQLHIVKLSDGNEYSTFSTTAASKAKDLLNAKLPVIVEAEVRDGKNNLILIEAAQ